MMAMTDADYRRAILAAPDEDAPRHAYAAFLEAHGQPEQAEFIRVQLAVARLPEGEGLRLQLEAREQELLDRHHAEWLAPLAELIEIGPFNGNHGFHRGFVEHLPITAANFLVHGSWLFQNYPVRHVTLRALRGTLKPLAESPLFARLTDLTLDLESWGRDEPFPIAELDRLLQSPSLVQLQGLEFKFGSLDGAGIRVLVASPLLPHLRRLYLSGMCLDAEAIQELTASPALQGLTELHLDNNGIGLAGVRAVADCPYLAGLTELGLGFNYVSEGCGQILAESPYLRQLNTLLLSESKMGDADLQALAVAPNMKQLRTLLVDDNYFTLDGARTLIESSTLVNLTTLWLCYCPLGDEGADLLANSRTLAGLTTLRLFGCGIGDAGARSIAASPHLAGLAVLDLRSNLLSSEGEEVLRSRFGNGVLLQMQRE